MNQIHPLFQMYGSEPNIPQLLLDIYDAVKAGAVRIHRHTNPEMSYLMGLDYTEACQYDKMWSKYPVARLCRGLVIDTDSNKIVALPFPKFMNLGEAWCDVSESELIACKGIVSEIKMDGSMGIIFWNNKSAQWLVKTRGGFTSPQALVAQSWINPMGCAYYDWTILAEIIYPENRVVVDYGDYRGFVVFGSYSTKDGRYREHTTSSFCGGDMPLIVQPSPPKNLSKMISDFDSLKQVVDKLSSNEEGFVVVMDDGRRCKIKGEKYLELHKAKFNTSLISVWENMCNGTVEAARKLIPEELHPMYDGYLEALENKYNVTYALLWADVKAIKALLPYEYTQKDLALKMAECKMNPKSKTFAFLDYKTDPEKCKKEFVLSLIRPDGNKL